MNTRAQRRAPVRNSQKQAKVLDKLTDNQLKLVDSITEFRADELNAMYKKLVDIAMFAVMRDNKISVERAKRIVLEVGQKIWADEHVAMLHTGPVIHGGQDNA
jgi:hypothetical protein